ncbi:FAD-dependent oxidoreductase [Lampropedia puyangensis]|uniref:tRNA 5-methylaminomethyl-2-thiouridine biosynthesis bifunctional protein MnmC n=1 Tax=Lampropedia puyangensis TaxID=1330072 RepID=A0A4S8F2S4_9BURK|nr:tRNA (5-methylaminomethyl-2-thiouridine)(34)-methyltransferase MnmD [Lampropedia puyangensis]THU00695.1 FAD-dependent oxidoreductase [Lampropedia puyangensis]
MTLPTQPPDSALTLDWLEDGAPYSSRFDDRYHSHQDGGTTQSRGSFLHGCGLPAAWAGQAQWRILETGFGLGLNFLVTWQAWREDPQRPQQLHFISTEAWPVSAQDLLAAAKQRYPQLLPLAQELAEQYWDMHSGIHRISLDNNRVHLTLAIGDAKTWLRSEGWQADSVYLDGFNPAKNPDIWSLDTLKAVARCCIAGHTQLATWCVARNVRDALAQCGFQVERVAGTPPKKHNLKALFAPAWTPKQRTFPPPFTAAVPRALRECAERHCIVIGAGIAGAHTARAMAERGWHVTVLEQADTVAQGASALPAGLFAPHISPDDAPLSRLTRQGIRNTRKTAARLLPAGIDWDATGVLEHRVDKKLGLPAAATPAPAPAPAPPPPTTTVAHTQTPATGTGSASTNANHATAIPSDASIQASPEQRLRAGIDAATGATAQHAPAVFHTQAGWIKPAKLVAALLQHPLITIQTSTQVASITAAPPDQIHGDGQSTTSWPRWQVNTSQGQRQADCLILAAAHASKALAEPLLPHPLPLNAVRGQVAWGTAPCDAADVQWPAWPVNGKGSLVHWPCPGSANERFWISGGTFEREDLRLPPSPASAQAALAENRNRLPVLLPAWGNALASLVFNHARPNTWAGVRCTVPDRTPLYGALAVTTPSLLLAAGLGSRGLTLASLCAETLVCALHDEPLPLERTLAQWISTQRWLTLAQPTQATPAPKQGPAQQ